MQTDSKWLWVSLSLLFIVVGRLFYWTEPFGVSVDESTYMSIAEILNSGGTLYLDAVDRKPPAFFWIFQLVGAVFGEWNIHAVHALFIGIFFALGLLAWAITKTPWALLLYSIFSSCFPREIASCNGEVLMLVPLGLACWFFVEEVVHQRKPALWVFSVACFIAGFATMIKQYAALVYAPVYISWALYFLWQAEGSWVSKLLYQLKAALASGVGLLFSYLPFFYYFRESGAFQEFIVHVFTDNLTYIETAASASHAGPWFSIFGMLISWIPLWLLLAYRFTKTKDLEWLLYLVAAFGAICTAFLSGRYYTHYFVPAIWFLVLLVAPTAEEFWKSSSRSRRVLASTGVAIVFLFFAVFNTARDSFSDRWSFTKQHQSKMLEAATWIQENSLPSDRIIVWGMATQFFPMAQRGSGSRYVFADLVAGRLPGLASGVSAPLEGAMERYRLDIQMNKPKFFVDTSTAELNDYGSFPLTRFPEFKKFLERYFVRQLRVADFDIWVRKD